MLLFGKIAEETSIIRDDTLGKGDGEFSWLFQLYGYLEI